MQPEASTEFYATQQAASLTARNEVTRLWGQMGDDFDASWRRISTPIFAAIATGQAEMARAAADYVPAVLSAVDVPDRPVADFRPERFVGVASDGRPLDTLAYQAVVTSKVAVAGGATTRQALEEGSSFLSLMAKLQVADAARQAVGVLTAARPNLAGHVRVLNPPVCQRCAVLGGRVYRWSTGFDRHPGDDCTMMPVKDARWAEAEGFVLDPMKAYRNGEIKDLTEAQVKALEEGADLAQVVNAYRGMSTTATETAKSVRLRRAAESNQAAALRPSSPGDLLAFVPNSIRFSQSVTTTRLLTPEGIYQQARNRTEAIALLREFGYLT